MNNTAYFDGVPVARLRKADIPLKHQFDVFKQTTAPLFDIKPIGDTDAFSGSMTGYLVDQLIFTQASFDELQLTRTPQHCARYGTDCIVLQYCYSGGFHGTLASGAPLNMTGDVISIQDLAHPFRGIGQSDCFFSIIIPRHAMATLFPRRSTLHAPLYQHYPTLSLPVNSPVGRVLTQAWLTLWETLPTTSQADVPAIAQGFIGLLNGLFSGLFGDASRHVTSGHQAAPVTLPTENAMKAYLRENLHLPNANADTLFQVFHCSRATVYRLFKTEGGVQAYVRSQRLTRCYRALQQRPLSSRKTIRDIANQWGFTDAASFSRLFRKRYGLSPSDVDSERPKTLMPVLDKADYWLESDRFRQWLEIYRGA